MISDLQFIGLMVVWAFACLLYFAWRDRRARMNKRRHCSAVQMSDSMVCDECGLIWDMNDSNPPKCL